MRRWTYKSFLKDYVGKLSYKDTLHLNSLLNEAENDNPRLREVLLLHMLENYGEKVTMSKLSYYHNLQELFENYKNTLLNQNYKYDNNNPFYKVHNSFLVKRDYYKNQENYKIKLLEQIKKSIDDNKISKYKIYTRLNLNPGNINFAIKHLDSSKISEHNLEKIYEFIRSQ